MHRETIKVNTYVQFFIFNDILSAVQITAAYGRIGLKGLEKRNIQKKRIFSLPGIEPPFHGYFARSLLAVLYHGTYSCWELGRGKGSGEVRKMSIKKRQPPDIILTHNHFT
jgi:hypothetical protein